MNIIVHNNFLWTVQIITLSKGESYAANLFVCLNVFFVDLDYLFVKLLRELSCTKNVLKVRVLFNLVLRGSRIFNREADLGSVGD